MTCLEINKANPSSAIFSEFNVERQSDEFSYNISLEKQSQENCYALVFPFDSDFSYIAYIDETQAYLYDTSFTVENMVQDLAQGGSQAVLVLSTENESYKECVVKNSNINFLNRKAVRGQVEGREKTYAR